MIVVAGESLVDLLVGADGSVAAAPGGGPYNVARSLGRLERPVAFIGRLSTDAFGRLLRARLIADDVDLSRAPTTDDPTLLAVAEIAADGTAAYRFHTAGTAAAGLSIADLGAGLPADTTALHVGTLGLVLEPLATTIVRLVEQASDDVLVMADPNCRAAAITDPDGYRARLARLMARVDVVKVSTDDLAWLDPGRDPIAAAGRLLERGPRAALLTDGDRAVRVVTPSGVVELAVPSVEVVDTVGAGDAFGAGFLAAWTAAGRGRADLGDGAALVAATRFAIEVGAWTCGRSGADPPTTGELRDAGTVW